MLDTESHFPFFALSLYTFRIITVNIDCCIILTGVSPVQLSELAAGCHELEITPLGCTGGNRTLSVQFTT